MAPSQPLLPIWGEDGREYRYLCATCGREGRIVDQFVGYVHGQEPPYVLTLACWPAALDGSTGIRRVPAHLYVLAEDRAESTNQ